MILNEIERAVICGKQEYRTNADFIDAIEAAVLAKLAQGVSVEPVIRGWMNPMNGVVIDPQRKKQIGVGDGYPNFSVPLYDESGTVTHEQLTTAIAAARVQALEDAAVLATPLLPRPCDCEVCDCGNSGDYGRVTDWDSSNSLAKAIRALKGAA